MSSQCVRSHFSLDFIRCSCRHLSWSFSRLPTCSQLGLDAWRWWWLCVENSARVRLRLVSPLRCSDRIQGSSISKHEKRQLDESCPPSQYPSEDLVRRCYRRLRASRQAAEIRTIST